MKRLTNIIKKAKEYICNMLSCEQEETEIVMSARDMGIINEEFESLYDKLITAEENLKDIATRYTIGEEDIKMKEVDDAFSDVKKPMAEIRRLALEAREVKKEEND